MSEKKKGTVEVKVKEKVKEDVEGEPPWPSLWLQGPGEA